MYIYIYIHIYEICAVSTIANARVRLYKMMYCLGISQRTYCDIDSVICVCGEASSNHNNPYINTPLDGLEFGTGLGQWDDEFGGNAYIAECVIECAKSYSYNATHGCTPQGKAVVTQHNTFLERMMMM